MESNIPSHPNVLPVFPHPGGEEVLLVSKQLKALAFFSSVFACLPPLFSTLQDAFLSKLEAMTMPALALDGSAKWKRTTSDQEGYEPPHTPVTHGTIRLFHLERAFPKV